MGGTHDFFGPGSDFQIDSTKPVTVTTQFITNDGTDHGKLVEVKQIYQQDGKITEHPSYTVNGKQHNSITDDFCSDWVATTQDGTNFLEKEVWTPSRRPLMQVWFLSCLCGMTTMQTCSGWTLLTQWVPPNQAHTVVHAALTLGSLQMLRRSRPKPT